jgi:hypothetical protein
MSDANVDVFWRSVRAINAGDREAWIALAQPAIVVVGVEAGLVTRFEDFGSADRALAAAGLEA